MPDAFRRTLAALCCLACALCAAAPASAATLFRLFLKDGNVVVSYGEFTRVGDDVVFSMPVGGDASEPHLQAVTLPSDAIDWGRTNRYASSARYQAYAETRGEADFQQLSNDVAGLLNDIALMPDRALALQMAQQARRTLAEWPTGHYGYRQREVREIVMLLDEAIAGLSAAAGANRFELSLVAMAPDIELEPVYGMPPAFEIVTQLFTVARYARHSADRVAILQRAVALLDSAPAGIPRADAATMKSVASAQVREELAVDAQYAKLASRLVAEARRAAASARVAAVEKIADRIAAEDARLGGRRPDVVQALAAAVRGQLEAARQLRLLRDQWAVRRALYRDYQRTVGTQLRQLAKAQPALELIRRLDGPPPRVVNEWHARLTGGAERLHRMQLPESLRATHALVVNAWRFAEGAFKSRRNAIASGDMDTAWEASSAAAGALMMLSRAQADMRALLEPPRLK